MTLAGALSTGLAIVKGPLARSSIMSLGIRLLGIGLLLVQAVMAARLLGPAGYGTVAVILSIAQIAAIGALFGYHSHAVRKIASDLPHQRYRDIRRYVVKAIGVVLGLSALAGAIVVLAQYAYPTVFNLSATTTVQLLALVPLLGLIQLLKGVNQGLGQIVQSQVPHDLVRPAILIVALLVLVSAGWTLDPQAFLTCLVLAYALTLAGALGLTARSLVKLGTENGEEPSKQPTSVGPQSFFLLSLMMVLQTEFATLLLSVLATQEETGLYQPIARLLPLLALLITAALMPFVPRITELWSLENLPEVISLTRKFTLATTALTALSAITLAIAAPYFLLIFGPEFASVAPLVWIVAAAQVFRAMCGPVANLLVMAGLMREVLTGYIVALIVSIVCAYVLIPDHGVAGAVVAVAGNIGLWSFVMLILVRRKLGFDPSILSAIDQLTPSRMAAE